MLQEVDCSNEAEILYFCNEWNKKWIYGTAVYDKDHSGLHLDHTLPLPERMSDMFLFMQIYRHLALAAQNFFKEAEKFQWMEKNRENIVKKGESEA